VVPLAHPVFTERNFPPRGFPGTLEVCPLSRFWSSTWPRLRLASRRLPFSVGRSAAYGVFLMTEVHLSAPVSQPHAVLVSPRLTIALYGYLVFLLAVIVVWEYRRARRVKERPELLVEGFARHSK